MTTPHNIRDKATDIPRLGVAASVAVPLLLACMYGWYRFALYLHPPPVPPYEGLSTGEFGDLFGGLNTVVQSLALFAILYSILQQQAELAMQREELRLQRQEMRESRMYRTEPLVTVQKLGSFGIRDSGLISLAFEITRMDSLASKNIDVHTAIALGGTPPDLQIYKHYEPLLAKSEARTVIIEGIRRELGSALTMTVETRLQYMNLAGGCFCVTQRFNLEVDVAGRVASISSEALVVESGDDTPHDTEEWVASRTPAAT